ncbi:uncharacterized protein LOC107471421 [Arachis duranensis]|uniref:Uncharacterized protein LOC107471421 n=1 Tax=Arachis duranensis TaxID=130453 RepID=A0A6P4C7C3_ARADU|nr:uncharacterized protein LOC107471421 [Arachis duranensis]
MAAFNLFISDNDLVDIGMTGRQYTWSNKRAESELIQERLDRVLVNGGLLQSFCHPTVLRLSENGSNHVPLLLNTNPQVEKTKRQFKFQERWCSVEEIRSIIREAGPLQLKVHQCIF